MRGDQRKPTEPNRRQKEFKGNQRKCVENKRTPKRKRETRGKPEGNQRETRGKPKGNHRETIRKP